MSEVRHPLTYCPMRIDSKSNWEGSGIKVKRDEKKHAKRIDLRAMKRCTYQAL